MFGLRCQLALWQWKLLRFTKRNYSSQTAVAVAEVPLDEQSEVKYPEIQDLSFRGRKHRQRMLWHEQIKATPTIEEKLIKINMPRYYGYKVVNLNNERLPYNCLSAIQHYTRTIYEEYTDEEQKVILQAEQPSNLEDIKADIQGALEVAYDCFKLQYCNNTDLEQVELDKLLTQMYVEQINRILINRLMDDYQHLRQVDVDYNPRMEAFWAVGGISPPKNVVRFRKAVKWQNFLVNDSVDRLMQYKGSPMIALRHNLQLSPTVQIEKNFDKDIQEQMFFKYDPCTLGFQTYHQHGTNIAGYWPNRLTNFSYLTYEFQALMKTSTNNYTSDDINEMIQTQAILSSFSYLLAQANYYGFNTYNELTYPMNTQTIITNGRCWSFHEYQLNTLLIHGQHVHENPLVNYCRGVKSLNLYEEIDANGKLVGFNDDVLKHLIRFYTNIPNIQREDSELRPYVSNEVKRVEQYKDDQKRIFLEKTYKHLYANRPRHLEIPEIYMWEKLYKIDNNTRPMDARRRFFELNINPWKRTLDQHDKKYIPKVLRPYPKSKKKWEETFYP